MKFSTVSFWLLSILVVFCAILMVSYIGMDYISPNDSGFSYIIEQGAKILIVIIATWCLVRFFEYFVWKSYKGQSNSFFAKSYY